jgi:hypothetical protein
MRLDAKVRAGRGGQATLKIEMAGSRMMVQ